MVKAKPSSLYLLFQTELQAAAEHRNSNDSNILPVTTLRTIDLEGKKNFDPLFSKFCGEMSFFFEGIFAPECVHNASRLRPEAAGGFPAVQRNVGAV